MADYQSNIELAEAARMLREAGHVTVVTHAKPDGDAFGSVTALTAALRSLGHNVTGWLIPPIAENLGAMAGIELISMFEHGATLGDTDLVAVLDTGAEAQLSFMLDQMRAHEQRTLIIDHHLSGDLPARWRYIEGQAAACCQIIAQLVELLGVPLSEPVIRDALFVGIAADTGWFRYSNTTASTHDLAGRLLRAGVDHADLYAKLQQTERPEKLALMTRALDSLQLLANNSVALMVLRAGDFAGTGSSPADTEQLVDIPQMVGSVKTVVLITEPPASAGDASPAIRVSFRSKPGPDALNVADLAGRFGGGGHARAAGAKIKASLDDAVARICSAVAG